MKTAVMRAEAAPPDAPKGSRKPSTDGMARRSRNPRRWGETPSSLLLGRVELSKCGGSTESRPTDHKSSRPARPLRHCNVDCAETPPTASSRQALAEPIIAALAGAPHPGRRKWQNCPPYGRQLPLAGRAFSLSILWIHFSKRTHMMAPVETEKHRFPVENVCFDVQRWGNRRGFFTKRTQMIQPRPTVFHPYCNPTRYCFFGRIFGRKRTLGTQSRCFGRPGGPAPPFGDRLRVNSTQSDPIQPVPGGSDHIRLSLPSPETRNPIPDPAQSDPIRLLLSHSTTHEDDGNHRCTQMNTDGTEALSV